MGPAASALGPGSLWPPDTVGCSSPANEPSAGQTLERHPQPCSTRRPKAPLAVPLAPTKKPPAPRATPQGAWGSRRRAPEPCGAPSPIWPLRQGDCLQRSASPGACGSSLPNQSTWPRPQGPLGQADGAALGGPLGRRLGLCPRALGARVCAPSLPLVVQARRLILHSPLCL